MEGDLFQLVSLLENVSCPLSTYSVVLVLEMLRLLSQRLLLCAAQLPSVVRSCLDCKLKETGPEWSMIAVVMQQCDVQVAGTPMQLFLPNTVIFQHGVLRAWYYSNSVRWYNTFMPVL